MGLEQQDWPLLSLTQLHLSKTQVTTAALVHLSVLPQLQFLDVR